MKRRVKLSRAFGTTPSTVYKRAEYAFKMSNSNMTAAPRPGYGADETFAPVTEKAPLTTRVRVPMLIALSVLLLALTALLLLEPDFTKNKAPVSGAGQAGGVNVKMELTLLDEKEVRATAHFSTAEGGQMRYFWYDGQALPDVFPAVTAAENEKIYYIYCALMWQAEGKTAQSDLASAQTDNKGLNVMMSGEWQQPAEEVFCRVVIVPVNADGTYDADDVSSLTMPM